MKRLPSLYIYIYIVPTQPIHIPRNAYLENNNCTWTIIMYMSTPPGKHGGICHTSAWWEYRSILLLWILFTSTWELINRCTMNVKDLANYIALYAATIIYLAVRMDFIYTVILCLPVIFIVCNRYHTLSVIIKKKQYNHVVSCYRTDSSS